MAEHNILGKQGEEWATKYLLQNNFTIIEKNWRHSYYEVDIIAFKENTLHFIEVKTRQENDFTYPEESVNRKKMNNLKIAADYYLEQYPNYKWVEYDIIAITVENNQISKLDFITDVYF